MSTNSNVFSQGGGGTHYEFEFQTAYFIAFLLGCELPGLPKASIKSFRQQAGSLGYKTDDLLITCSDSETTHRVLFQVKHNIVISFSSDLFKDALLDAWTDFANSQLFNQDLDRIYLIKSALTLTEKNHLKQILNWAKRKATAADFVNEVSRIKEKNNYYQLFKTFLTEKDDSISDEEIFQFLKCFDVLEYDFGNVSSVSKANFLSLLEVSKASVETSAQSIWNEAFAFVSDSDSKGGYFTIENIPAHLSAYFSKPAYSHLQQMLIKLSKQNFEILDFIDDTIGKIKLERQDLLNEALNKFNTSQILFINGDPGVGKSAIVKSLFEHFKQQRNGYFLLYQADQFNKGNLRDVFTPYGIQASINEILSCFPLYTNNIIYLDAVEKLLEGEGIAFKQLLKAISDLPVKLILSCRKANFNLIELKFFKEVTYERVQIPILSDEELNFIITHEPVFTPLLRNKRIASLIKTPKYLDYAYKALIKGNEGYEDLNEVDFIDKLWMVIVENKINENSDGLPARRNKLLVELAVQRAKRMQPFVKLPVTDDLTVEKLIKDNVIAKSNHAELYAPAHDVIEDWALIRYVDNQFAETDNSSNLFDLLGTEPAMRRAYRLWVQMALQQQDVSKINFFTKNLINSSLDRFWQDESLIAVLNSNNCKAFFEKNESLLQADEWKLLFRILHVMRTACREKSEISKGKAIMLPTGYGWVPLIKLIHQNITTIASSSYDLILLVIEEWSNITINNDGGGEGVREAGILVIYLLNAHYKTVGTYYYEDKQVEKCLRLLFRFAGGIQEELTDLFKKALDSRSGTEDDEDSESPNDWIEQRYQSKVLTLSLEGLHSAQLPRFLPDMLITIANKLWIKKPKKTKKPSKGSLMSFISEHDSLDNDHHFGLAKHIELSTSTSSAYQTFLLGMLRVHPYKALDFIIDLLNRTTKKYISSSYAKQDDCIVTEIELSNGIRVKQYGSYVLWMMYRGTGKATPYLLQSVLMALEYYLLEIGNAGTIVSEAFQSVLNYLYTKSTSVATTSVIASVCMAYPEMAGKEVLPLFKNKHFFSWDISRYTGDRSHTHVFIDKSVFDEERLISDKLPHRTKYYGGLKSFIVDFCFTVQTYNQEVFAIIDRYKELAEPNDIVWRKTLDEMDIRKWRAVKQLTEGESFAVVVEPTYSEEISPTVEGWKAEYEEANINAGYHLLINRVQKKEELMPIEKWVEIYAHLNRLESYNPMHHSPGTLAMIGIRDLWNELDNEQKGWSVSFIIEILESLIRKQYKSFDFSWDYSPYDVDSAMFAAPFLITLPDLAHEKENLQKLLIRLLTAHFQLNDPDYPIFLKSFDEHLWKEAPEEAIKLFRGLLAYGKFSRENHFYIDSYKTEEEATAYINKYANFVNDVYENKFLTIIDDFNYTDYSKGILNKAILILPTYNPSAECLTFLRKIMDLWLQTEINKAFDSSFDEAHYRIRLTLQDKISATIFWNAQSLVSIGSELLRYMISRFCLKDILDVVFKRNDVYTLFNESIRKLILITGNNLLENNKEKSTTVIANFKTLWTAFDVILTSLKVRIFSDLLLLNIHWSDTDTNWLPIEGMSDFFEIAIKKYGSVNIPSVLNLLSHVGDKTLLPQGINWLVDILKTAKNVQPLITYKDSEQLMHRVYDNHIMELKADKELFGKYLWMLDEMITHGSSDAYWIREFLISFR